MALRLAKCRFRGPWVASATTTARTPNRTTSDGWLRTGDVASVSSDGYVTLVDRAKDVIKSGGEWVSSVDLENAIMSHPMVAEAAVIGLSHPVWQERPVAYVVPRAEHRDALTAADIKQHLSSRVAKWWLPDEVRFIDAVPRRRLANSTRNSSAPARPPWSCMLKGLDPLLNADVLRALRAMGHGDELVVCDANFPADSIARQTVIGQLLRIDGVSAPRAVRRDPLSVAAGYLRR